MLCRSDDDERDAGDGPERLRDGGRRLADREDRARLLRDQRREAAEVVALVLPAEDEVHVTVREAVEALERRVDVRALRVVPERDAGDRPHEDRPVRKAAEAAERLDRGLGGHAERKRRGERRERVFGVVAARNGEIGALCDDARALAVHVRDEEIVLEPRAERRL